MDLLANRAPFYDAIAKMATLADKKQLSLVASPISFTTVNYVLSKFDSAASAIDKMRKFKVICEICPVDENVIEKALNSDFKNFEGAVQYFCALNSNSQIIITHNGKDLNDQISHS